MAKLRNKDYAANDEDAIYGRMLLHKIKNARRAWARRIARKFDNDNDNEGRNN